MEIDPTSEKPPQELIPPYRYSVTSVLPEMAQSTTSVARFKLKLLQLFDERGTCCQSTFNTNPLI